MPYPSSGTYPDPTLYPGLGFPDDDFEETGGGLLGGYAVANPVMPGRVTPKWKFILANSNDLSHIGELDQARARTLQVALNRPGTLSFTLPLFDDLADDVTVISKAIKAYRNGTLVWSGPIVNISEDANARSMTVNCAGWLMMLQKRLLRQKKIYSSTDDGAIVYDLLAEANLTTAPDGYSVPVLSGASPATPTLIQAGSTQPNEGSGGATAYVTQARNKTYEKWTPIGQEIETLTTIENGLDWHIRPDTRHLDVYRMKQRDRRAMAVFGYNWGPDNVQQFSREIDSSTLVNYHVTTGRSGVAPQFADDATSKATYGLFEEIQALSDISNTGVLQAFSGGEVVLRSEPRVTFSLTPYPFTGTERVPEPFVDYDIGDLVEFTAIRDRITVAKQGARVHGINVTITDDGNEQIGQLQILAS